MIIRHLSMIPMTLVVIAIDLSTKAWAETLTEPVVVIPGLLQFQLAYNNGIAFSLPLPTVLQISLSLVLMTALMVIWLKNNDWLMHIGTALIFGGAIGNLSQRVQHEPVTDFIAVWKFPIWNVADMAIFVGVCLLLWREWCKGSSRQS